MRLCGRQNEEGTREPTVERGESSSMLSVYQHHIPRASAIRGQPASPPIPGILKARIKHEQWCHFVPRISIVQRTFCPLGTYWKVTSWKWEGAGDHMRAVACSWTIKSNWYRDATCWSTPLFFFFWLKGLNVEILCECVALGSQTWELIMVLPSIPVAMKIHCGEDGSRWSLLLSLSVWY